MEVGYYFVSGFWWESCHLTSAVDQAVGAKVGVVDVGTEVDALLTFRTEHSNISR